MSVVSETPPVAPDPIRGRRFPAILIAALLLIPIGLLNRYVFADTNLPILGAFVLIAALGLTRVTFPRRLFPDITSAFLCFAVYAWLRLDDPTAFNLDMTSKVASGFTHVFDLGIFYLLFVSSALAYARTGRLSRTLWFLISGYVIAYILRNSGDIAGLQDGYNLSPGFVICSLLPFAFLVPGADAPRLAPLLLALLCAFWLALIGARAATGTIIVFLGTLWLWPWFTRSKLRHAGVFIGLWIVIALFHVLYFMYATNSTDPLVAGATFGIFEKRIGTRIEIWSHLALLIAQSPWTGYGTDQTTLNVAPLPILEFTLNRDNLGSHSLYFELLYRLGIFGLLGLMLVIAAIWRLFWTGRHEWTVRVVGSFLVSALVFSMTGEYLVFGSLRLENGFAWALLGIGAGACLRSRKRVTNVASANHHAPQLDRHTRKS